MLFMCGVKSKGVLLAVGCWTGSLRLVWLRSRGYHCVSQLARPPRLWFPVAKLKGWRAAG